MIGSHRPCPGEDGFLLVGVLATLIPLLILVGSAMSLMMGRNQELLQRVHREQAFLAAESGIDDAVFLASNGNLPSGTVVDRQVGPDFGFSIDPLHLGSDGVDNDGDAAIDEPDENVLRVIVTGRYLQARRRLVAYLQPVMTTISLPGAMTFQDPTVDVETEKDFVISGIDTNLDGTPGPGPDTHGISILEPGTVASVSAELELNPGLVDGIGGNPSITTSTVVFDLEAIRAAVMANADMVVTDTHENVTWGNSATGDWKVVYAPDRLRIRSGRGAGILFVRDRLEIEDNFEWHGLIIAIGEAEFEADKSRIIIRGGFLSGPAANKTEDYETEIEDAVSIIYSTQALNAVSTLLPSPGAGYMVTGWKEISAK